MTFVLFNIISETYLLLVHLNISYSTRALTVGIRGNNVSHVVIMRPLKAGYFNFSSAELSYLPSESATEPQVRTKIIVVHHACVWLIQNVTRYHLDGIEMICPTKGSSTGAHRANAASLQPTQQLSDISANPVQCMPLNGTSLSVVQPSSNCF